MPFLFVPLEKYKECFESAGFSLERLEMVHSKTTFVNVDDAVEWFMGTSPLIHFLPEEKRKAYFYAQIKSYVSKNKEGLTSEGVLYLNWNHFEIIAVKKGSLTEIGARLEIGERCAAILRFLIAGLQARPLSPRFSNETAKWVILNDRRVGHSS